MSYRNLDAMVNRVMSMYHVCKFGSLDHNGDTSYQWVSDVLYAEHMYKVWSLMSYRNPDAMVESGKEYVSCAQVWEFGSQWLYVISVGF